MNNSKTLGYLLQDRRRAKGLSVEKVAEETSLSVGTIRALEQSRRRPSAASLRPILECLDLKLDWDDENTLRLDDGTVYNLALHKGGHPRVSSPIPSQELDGAPESMRLQVIQKILDADIETIAAINRLLS